MQKEKEAADTPDKKTESKNTAQKHLVDELKTQWKRLWDERFDDKVRAEGVSVSDYEALFVEQGTIIHANKDFKALNFKQILEQHLVENPDRYIQPNANSGGWSKFIKKEVNRPASRKHRSVAVESTAKPKGQPKKGGRGWLHKT